MAKRQTKKQKTNKTRQQTIKTSKNNEYNKWKEFGFPLVKNYLNPVQLFNRLKSLNSSQKYKQFINHTPFKLREKFAIIERDIRFRSKFISVFIDMKYYHEMDIITDYYTEKSRIMVKRIPNEYSLLEHYEKGDLLNRALEKLHKQGKPVTTYNLREVFYEFPDIYNASPESTIFYICLLNTLFRKEQLTNLVILDGAGGYGTRLMTELVLGCRYYGVEPNKFSTPGFTAMINDFGNSSRQIMFEDGLPTAPGVLKMHDNSADVVFFSPPLFDGEVYPEDPKQSTSMFTDFKSWKYKFLHKSIEVLLSKLKKGGYIVFQSLRYDYIREYMQKQKNMKFAGVICRKTYAGRYKPNWIWCKI